MSGLSKLALSQSGKGNQINPSSGASAGTNYSASPVNVMPTALNLGQIIQPYTQPTTNGGSGFPMPSAFSGTANTVAGTFSGSGGSNKTLLIAGAALAATLVGVMIWKG